MQDAGMIQGEPHLMISPDLNAGMCTHVLMHSAKPPPVVISFGGAEAPVTVSNGGSGKFVAGYGGCKCESDCSLYLQKIGAVH